MKDDSLLLDFRALALTHAFTGAYLSKIITTHGDYYSELSPTELLNRACLRHHSSKKGRKEAARHLLKYQRKIPFLISDELAVFPTSGSNHPDCMYIFSRFFEEESVDKNKTQLTFDDGTVIDVPISLYTVRQQKLKVSALLNHLQQSKRTYITGQPLYGIQPDFDFTTQQMDQQ